MTRRYHSPMRAERAAQTRARIVSAGAELTRSMASWDWRKVTVRAVAERAGVHDRTVYRHFATEQDLRDAVVQRLYEDAGVDLEGLRLDDLQEHVAAVFRYFASFTSFTPKAHDDPSLDAVDARRKGAILTAITNTTPDWSEDDRRYAAALVDVLWGVPTYQRLISGWGLSPEQVTQAVGWLLGLLAAAVRDGRRPTSSVD